MNNNKVTSYEVAQMAGVSQSTVSRVLSGTKLVNVSESTKKKVMDAAKKLRYSPNDAARILATGKTNKILILIPHVYQTFYASFLYYFQILLENTNYELLFCDRSNTVDWVKETYVSDLLKWNVDAIISVSCNLVGKEDDLFVPFVYFGEPSVEYDYNHKLTLDLYNSTVSALKFLLDRGRKNIVFLTPQNTDAPWNNRLMAYKNTLLEAGLEEKVILCNGNSKLSGKEEIEKYLSYNSNKIDAVFCYNDYLAIATHSAVISQGMKIPDDIAIIGYDGIEDRLYFHPTISSLKINVEEVCAGLLDLTFRKLEDINMPREHKIIVPFLDIQGSV